MEENDMDVDTSRFQGQPSASCSPIPGSEPPTNQTTDDTQYTSIHTHQISMAEFNQQSHQYTQEAVRNLKASPEYKKHTMKCHSCTSSWYNGQFLKDCSECGGYAMHRPCPICHGFCGKMWGRNVDMSHAMSEAHWNGTCAHTEAAQLLKDMVYMENITDAMEALGTTSDEPT